MKARLPLLVFLALAAAFAAFLWLTYEQLPERVAGHFDARGRPDSVTSRGAMVRSMALIGLGLPLVIIAVFTSLRFTPARFINIPHRDHWLSDEHRAESLRWIGRAGVWFACSLLLFVATIHYSMIRAHQVQPPQLDGATLWMAVALEFACVIALIVGIYRRFSKPRIV